MLGLQYEDVSWDDNAIHVSHAIQYIRGQGLLKTELYEAQVDSCKEQIRKEMNIASDSIIILAMLPPTAAQSTCVPPIGICHHLLYNYYPPCDIK